MTRSRGNSAGNDGLSIAMAVVMGLGCPPLILRGGLSPSPPVFLWFLLCRSFPFVSPPPNMLAPCTPLCLSGSLHPLQVGRLICCAHCFGAHLLCPLTIQWFIGLMCVIGSWAALTPHCLFILAGQLCTRPQLGKFHDETQTHKKERTTPWGFT